MEIRPVQLKDISSLKTLITRFAEFDGSSDKLNIEENQLSEAFFGADKKLHALVIEKDNSLIGFLNYEFSYSSFTLKPCLWVEDVFVIEEFRNNGLGSQLFYAVREIAVNLECERLEWLVRRNNKIGIDFYNKLGASVDIDTCYVSWNL